MGPPLVQEYQGHSAGAGSCQGAERGVGHGLCVPRWGFSGSEVWVEDPGAARQLPQPTLTLVSAEPMGQPPRSFW